MPAVSATTRFQFFCGGVFATVAILHSGLLRIGWQGVLPGIALVSTWWALLAFSQPAWNRLHATTLASNTSPRSRFRFIPRRLATAVFVFAQTLLALGFAIINLVLFPFGTGLGAYALWVLLNDEGRSLFVEG